MQLVAAKRGQQQQNNTVNIPDLCMQIGLASASPWFKWFH